jgi:hypothetical protein
MEIPTASRATITDIYNGVEIIVPSNKPTFFIVRMLGAIAFAVVFYFFFWRSGPSMTIGQHIDAFTIFVLCVGGLALSLTLYQGWWILAGKEIITVADGVLTITKKGAPAKTISYDLKEAKDFRAVKEDEIINSRDWSNVAYRLKVATQGTIKFDYGVETVQFGDLLSQPEGEYILKKLRDKKLIT